MQVNPYLVFSGQCETAFKFYAQCLNGKIESMITHGETPAAQYVPADWHSKIMHAHLTAGDVVLMGSDAPADHFEKPQGFSVALQTKDPTEAERLFHALAEKGTVRMPIQETFWATRFGMLVDRFGIQWMVNCQKSA